MKRKLYWTLGVGLVGLLLATKETYWFSGTYETDAETSALGILAGGIIGFLLSCIVEETEDKRKRRLKVLYWLFAMSVFGFWLGFGKGVSIRTSLIVMTSTLTLGLAFGTLQYFAQSRKNVR